MREREGGGGGGGRVGFSLPTKIRNKPLDSNVKDIHSYTQKFKQKYLYICYILLN